MTRYRKTALIEATQWWTNGDHPDDGVGEQTPDLMTGEPYQRIEGNVVRFYRHPGIPGDSYCGHRGCQQTMNDHGWIDTLEGGHIVCPGDWVATGVQGEHWAIKPDIFAATYEAVDEVSS